MFQLVRRVMVAATMNMKRALDGEGHGPLNLKMDRLCMLQRETWASAKEGTSSGDGVFGHSGGHLLFEFLEQDRIHHLFVNLFV